jgi:hypothetical protein
MRGTLLLFTRPGAPARRLELSVPKLALACAGALLAAGGLGLVGWQCGQLLARAAL